LSDLPNFEPNIRPKTIKRNNYVSPDWVARKKLEESGEIHPSVNMALHWIKNVFTGETINPNYGVERMFFQHPVTKFNDTNNLSVVTFLRCNTCGIMFPGDLECKGWLEFLKDASFVECL